MTRRWLTLRKAALHLPAILGFRPLAPLAAPVDRDDGAADAQFFAAEAMIRFAVEGGIAQDAMAQETMGPIYDRTQERLGTSDLMIIRTRRKLLECVRAFQKGAPAPGVNRPELYRLRSGGVIVPKGTNGLDAMADLLFDRVPLDEFRTRWEATVG